MNFKYFIPAIGFILAMIDNGKPNSAFDQNFREFLGLIYIFYTLIVHLPAIVGLIFYIFF